MANESDVIIRPYRPSDRVIIRKINYETSFLHQPHLFCDDPEIVADALTRYYTDFEPEACFVAEVNGQVIGYVIGTLNIRKMNREYLGRILLPVLGKALWRGVLFHPKTLAFAYHSLKSYLKGEFRVPDFSHQYPSTFHINVRDGYRGQRVGSRLILRAVQLLYDKNVPGVQFSTMSQDPNDFFISMGFHIVYDSRRTFLKYALGRETPFYLFGMSVQDRPQQAS
ncbi:MAG: GNAT family N-acetyltransferase [Candidatus Omnitrophica bacterium]|nr:GNAT family N-acetyltransferase [Candidatus Omnitrophota bacterium]